MLPLRLSAAVHRAIIEHSSDAQATVINEWYSNQSDATHDDGYELRQDYRYRKLGRSIPGISYFIYLHIIAGISYISKLIGMESLGLLSG